MNNSILCRVMIITKKESKQLRYFARANYKSDVKGTTAEDGSKVKHREFPVFGLSYNESKADNGMVELTDIQVLYKPFTGTTFEELMDALKSVLGSDEIGEPVKVEEAEQHYKPCLLYGPDCTQEPLPSGPPIVQPIAKPQEESVDPIEYENLGILKPIPRGLIKNEAECLEALAPYYKNYPPKESASVADIPEEVKENVLEVAETVTTLVHPEMQVVSKEIKDLSEDGTLTVDVKAVADNPVDSVDVHIDVNKLKEQNTYEDSVPESTQFSVDSMETDGMLTVTANIVMSDVVESVDTPIVVNTQTDVVEPVIASEIVTEDSSNDSVDSVKCAMEFIKEQPEPITPVESIHVDTARDGTKDVTGIIDTTGIVKQKKLTRAELNDLRIKCATMRLAESYGEPPETPIMEIVKKYSDSAMKLNDLYVADKIKPYTISEDAIREAYPEEYEYIQKNNK